MRILESFHGTERHLFRLCSVGWFVETALLKYVAFSTCCGLRQVIETR